MISPPQCVLCPKTAITTAAGIPVCGSHWAAYQEEAMHYPPMSERVVYSVLLNAYTQRRSTVKGSHTLKAGNIDINAISPKAKDLLETLMADWSNFKEQVPQFELTDEVYAFAYWLCRWSGLVQPAAEPAPPGNDILPAERAALKSLGNAWAYFLDLPERHPADNREFESAIHQAQNIILARLALRVMNKED